MVEREINFAFEAKSPLPHPPNFFFRLSKAEKRFGQKELKENFFFVKCIPAATMSQHRIFNQCKKERRLTERSSPAEEWLEGRGKKSKGTRARGWGGVLVIDDNRTVAGLGAAATLREVAMAISLLRSIT